MALLSVETSVSRTASRGVLAGSGATPKAQLNDFINAGVCQSTSDCARVQRGDPWSERVARKMSRSRVSRASPETGAGGRTRVISGISEPDRYCWLLPTLQLTRIMKTTPARAVRFIIALIIAAIQNFSRNSTQALRGAPGEKKVAL